MISKFRLDGIYPQRQEGFYMLRVKLAAGIISSLQAVAVADIAERFGKATIHLTSRGSMEIHWLQEQELTAVAAKLAAAGLTSRGACGGAVRGVSCSTACSVSNPNLERLARRIHRHFTGNPRFERIPKKFKVAVEGEAASGRHLIQDAGILFRGEREGVVYFDLYAAGGLGREPQQALLLAENLPEQQVIPAVEAIIDVYTAHTPAGKRLKHLLQKIGEEKFRELLSAHPSWGATLPDQLEISPSPLYSFASGVSVTAHILCGELDSVSLRSLSSFADSHAGGWMVVTTDQNIVFYLDGSGEAEDGKAELERLGFHTEGAVFRVCPGSHNCKMGLASTRDVAKIITETSGLDGSSPVFAISGCPNSCTQPQLADIGIIASSLVKNSAGEREPRFDIYHRPGKYFGEKIATEITAEGLIANVKSLIKNINI